MAHYDGDNWPYQFKDKPGRQDGRVDDGLRSEAIDAPQSAGGETPRTDEAERSCRCTVNGAVINGVVTAAFARQLECELIEERRYRAELIKVANELRALPSANVERDAARYRWLRGRISGEEYRRLGITYSDISFVDGLIDSAIAATDSRSDK